MAMASLIARKQKCTIRGKQYEVTKDLSNLNVNPTPIVAASAPKPITNTSSIISIIVKYDIPHVVLPDIPVLECPYDQVNTVTKIKALLESSEDVTSSLKEFYNLIITRDHLASYAIVIPANGIHERHQLNDQPFSYPRVVRVDVVLDVTKSILRCKQYRHADDVNAQTISDFEPGAAFGKYTDEIRGLNDEVARLERFLAEKTARANDEGTRAATDAGTIKYQREILLKYYNSEKEKDEELVALKDKVRNLEAALEATRPFVPAPTGRITRSESRRASGV